MSAHQIGTMKRWEITMTPSACSRCEVLGILTLWGAAWASGCAVAPEESHHTAYKIVVTSPASKTVTITQQYVSQIHSQRHIKVRSLERGYLEAIPIREGQQVKEGDLLFKVLPVVYQAKLDAENAEARIAQLEFNYTVLQQNSWVESPRFGAAISPGA